MSLQPENTGCAQLFELMRIQVGNEVDFGLKLSKSGCTHWKDAAFSRRTPNSDIVSRLRKYFPL